MKKILGVIFLSLLLSGCASLEGNVFSGMPKKSFCSAKSSGSFSAICNQKFFYYNNGVEVLKKGSEFAVFKNVTAPTLGDKGFSVRYGNGTYVRSVYSWSEAQNLVAMLDPTFSNSSTNSLTTSSSNSSNSSGNSYVGSSTNLQPQLFYDPNTNGMRECAHNGLSNGKCLSFKPSLTTHTRNTLFYNKNTGAMQPCMGSVNVLGQCSAFGLFNANSITKGQLFYDPKNNKMTTCSFVTVMGKCSMYDLTPNNWAKSSGGFRMTDPKNPYNKRSPRTPQQSIDVGMRMLSGGCTLGIDC